MAINSVGDNLATYGNYTTTTEVEDKTILGKDDFMTLLLVQMQHQDPTEPMDSAEILTQTSQLASLEASENTNKALEDLATSLGSSQQFSTIAAIGKTADLGSNAIGYEEGNISSFEVYFPESIASGNLEILDSEGSIVGTMDIEANPSGVYQFDWDGALSDGSTAQSGVYYITASYNDESGVAQTTRMGAYPIESVRFEGIDTLVKVGSSYININDIKEIY